jgi:hypothetical protein
MSKQKTRTLLTVVNELLKPNNTVTTLEVKNELRRIDQANVWNQDEVSATMDALNVEGKLEYTSNGVYRTYSLAGQPAGQPLTKFLLKPKKESVVSDISKTKSLEVIKGTNNRFFGVTFLNKDNEERKMVCRVPGDVEPDFLGYLRVIDTKDGGIKNVNMQTLSEIRTEGNVYRVR